MLATPKGRTSCVDCFRVPRSQARNLIRLFGGRSSNLGEKDILTGSGLDPTVGIESGVEDQDSPSNFVPIYHISSTINKLLRTTLTSAERENIHDCKYIRSENDIESCLSFEYKGKIKQIEPEGIADFLIPIKYSVYTTQKGEFRSTNRQIPFKIYLYYMLIPCSSYRHYMGAAKIGEVLSEC